ncbi:MAG: hypothetical protein IPO09_13025 [Anaeromyxobacter sp.]|nr:hypothetical protein [Anaeromyxobacter sp.]MBL0275109.1 hypothetical protein [Anaeromyxobacter sp.]
MRITSSSVVLASTHVLQRVSTRQESLKLWIGDEEPPDRRVVAARPGLPPPALAAAAQGAAAAPPAAPGDADGGEPGDAERARGTPRDELDLAILRRTFRLGRSLSRGAHEVRSAYADGRRAADEASQRTGQAHRAEGQAAEEPAREGWGLRYDLSETSATFERTTFAAAAQVTTADGRSIQLAAALSMERSELSTREVHLLAGDARTIDPLVLNLAGGAAAFAGTTRFDLDADGREESIAALGPGSAYLARDRDGDGAIGSGAELFGPTTGSGFGELAALDQDGNGWVDEGDAAFSSLRLWSPSAGTLTPLAAARVGALYTGAAATPFEVKGPGGQAQGAVAATGLFLREDGSAGTVQHVDLVA